MDLANTLKYLRSACTYCVYASLLASLGPLGARPAGLTSELNSALAAPKSPFVPDRGTASSAEVRIKAERSRSSVKPAATPMKRTSGSAAQGSSKLLSAQDKPNAKKSAKGGVPSDVTQGNITQGNTASSDTASSDTASSDTASGDTVSSDTTSSDATSSTTEPDFGDPPLISDPMQMSFKIKRLERDISPDARRYTSPRILTLTAVGPISHLNEAVWRGKKLGVFRAGIVDEKVGEIRIKSVYQATLQAEVVRDDLTRGIRDRQGAARVVMIGDVARLEKPIKAPPKRKVRRRRKPKKRGKYERDNMQWRL